MFISNPSLRDSLKQFLLDAEQYLRGETNRRMRINVWESGKDTLVSFLLSFTYGDWSERPYFIGAIKQDSIKIVVFDCLRENSFIDTCHLSRPLAMEFIGEDFIDCMYYERGGPLVSRTFFCRGNAFLRAKDSYTVLK